MMQECGDMGIHIHGGKFESLWQHLRKQPGKTLSYSMCITKTSGISLLCLLCITVTEKLSNNSVVGRVDNCGAVGRIWNIYVFLSHSSGSTESRRKKHEQQVLPGKVVPPAIPALERLRKEH